MQLCYEMYKKKINQGQKNTPQKNTINPTKKHVTNIQEHVQCNVKNLYSCDIA